MATESGRAGTSAGDAKRLGVGFVGAGFNARFHMQGWTGVRDADVQGVWSPDRDSGEGARALAHKLGVGEAEVLRRAARSAASVEVLLVEGGSHTFGIRHPWAGSTPEFDRVLERTVAFFTAALG